MNVSECLSRNVMQCQLFSHHRACRAPGSFVRSIPIWQQDVGQQDVARRCLAARLCAEVIHFQALHTCGLKMFEARAMRWGKFDSENSARAMMCFHVFPRAP